MSAWERVRTDGDEGRVEATPTREPIGLGRAMIVSVAVCTAVFVFGVGLPIWLMMGRLGDGLGLGLFVGFWGGPGFGLMAGGAVYTLSQERAARAALVARREPVVDQPVPKPLSVTAGDPAGALVAS